MKLAIISHTEHYKQSDGTIVGWGPTISEINHLAKDFEEIYHVAFLHSGTPPLSSLPYTSSKIKFVPLKPVGGKGVGQKLEIILNIPTILNTVQKTINKVDVFQLRTPTGIGVFLIPYLTLFTTKKGWFKYAGNWNQDNPPLGYALQRWMLKNQKRKVTINGSWPKQPKHCLTFENPCLTIAEREEGLRITQEKSFEPPYTFCFVGRLEDAKGVQRIVEAFGALASLKKVQTIHFIGNGEKMNHYQKQCDDLGLPAVFHGFLERQEVFEIYKTSHFILLPSTASEGFPKVIAEGMNFGCVPIVSDVSSIGQYINPNNGFIVNPCTAEELKQLLDQLILMDIASLKIKANESYQVAKDFTFEKYRYRIKSEILE
ncbi:glycosyltransferase [Aequorivita lipolytica]|uniref:Glycosyltransferase family 4 protein n=1 Tax=Aequorivita lipolytica TaxID=153267 RepID=A0A5C6YN09_9FLAO|nr:glycosyltransferase [Aequorivita lipolytica]TXD68809.1 glycosyltransferase family 4 protein [Aequorivita lipolytica]SRX52060.1 Glycosyltransferase Gtf1 [Aequorivita lipolytica]